MLSFSLEEKRKEEKEFRYSFQVKMLFKSQLRRRVGIVYIKANCGGRQEKIKDS